MELGVEMQSDPDTGPITVHRLPHWLEIIHFDYKLGNSSPSTLKGTLLCDFADIFVVFLGNRDVNHRLTLVMEASGYLNCVEDVLS